MSARRDSFRELTSRASRARRRILATVRQSDSAPGASPRISTGMVTARLCSLPPPSGMYSTYTLSDAESTTAPVWVSFPRRVMTPSASMTDAASGMASGTMLSAVKSRLNDPDQIGARCS